MDSLTSFKNFITKGGSPKQLLEQVKISNPIVGNLIEMAKRGNTENVETFARNICKEQGRDFDKEFAEFRSKFK